MKDHDQNEPAFRVGDIVSVKGSPLKGTIYHVGEGLAFMRSSAERSYWFRYNDLELIERPTPKRKVPLTAVHPTEDAALDIARLALDFAERHNHSGVVVQTETLRALIEEYEPQRRPSKEDIETMKGALS